MTRTTAICAAAIDDVGDFVFLAEKLGGIHCFYSLDESSLPFRGLR